MKSFKSHFVFNPSQRNGIFLLLIIIFILLGILWFFPFQPSEPLLSPQQEEETRHFQLKIDSMKLANKKENQPKIYPFNPNFITDYKGYRLGMSTEEIDRLHAFRAQGKWINSKADFQKVTKVSDSLLKKISPYFKFPEWVTNRSVEGNRKYSSSKDKDEKSLPFHLKKDLNTASAEDLKEINGIGDKLSQRIIRYRTKIGGFISDIQLKDIYGLDYEVEQRIKNQFAVKDTALVKKLNINTASLVELSEIPYFDYELARKIRDYRIVHEGIESFEELAKIEGFPAFQIERIKLYLTL